jgi:HPt (histidine-containing phosphotransfer) domain-containing protein
MIDWTRVNALRDEVGAEDFEEVVELFLQEVDAEVADLPSISPGTDLGEKLHFLKGSALSLGFEHFSTLCQSGEARLATDPDTSVDLQPILSSYHASREVFLAELDARTADQTNR